MRKAWKSGAFVMLAGNEQMRLGLYLKVTGGSYGVGNYLSLAVG